MSLLGCVKSNEEKAKEAIHTFLNENLDDITTYEPVKFGTLDTVYEYSVPAKSFVDELQMFHSFRIIGKEGNKFLVRKYFIFDSNLKIIESTDSSKPTTLEEASDTAPPLF